MIDRYQMAQTVRGYVGTPFVHQASLPGVGIDCIGVVFALAHEYGIPEAKLWRADPDHSYTRTPNPQKLLAACDRYLDRIATNAVTLADILVFRFLGEPMHFGVVTELYPMRMVHGFERVGEVAENVVDAKWMNRLHCAYRYRGID